MTASYPFIFPTVAVLEAIGQAAGVTVRKAEVDNLGSFVWSASSVATANGIDIIQVTGVATGRFLRVQGGSLSLSAYLNSGNSFVQCNDDAAEIGLTAVIDINYSLTANTDLTTRTYGSARWLGIGGVLSVGAYTLTGILEAPLNLQMFDISGGGSVILKDVGKVSVKWFGAKGDGTTDDTAAQNKAIASTPNGATVLWPSSAGAYKTSSTLSVTSSVTLEWDNGASIDYVTASSTAINITASSVTLINPNLTGPNSGIYDATGIGINVTGTFHAGLAPTYINNFYVLGGNISNFGAYGIQGYYIDGLQIERVTVANVPYAGIALSSVSHFHVGDNTIKNISGNSTPYSNAYGITITRDTFDSGNLTSQPRSVHGTIIGNVVDGVPTWEAFDTHSGQNITFIGNTAINCSFGVGINSSKNSAGTYSYAPLDITVIGNSLDSGVTNGSAAEGITFTGCAAQQATGTIVGNLLKYFGTSTTTDGAIRASYTTGLTISSNSIYRPSPYGIYLGGYNYGLAVDGNSIIDPWTNAAGVGQAVGLRSAGDYNIVSFSGNQILHIDQAATYLITTASGIGVYISSGTGCSLTYGSNNNQATGLLYAPSCPVSGYVTANGTTPVSVTAPTVQENSIIALIPDTGQTGKGAFVSAVVPGTSFSITSLAGDTSVYAWRLLS